MTRNRELDLEDLRDCEHAPEFPIVDDDNIIVAWCCACGRRTVGPLADATPDQCIEEAESED